MRFVTAILLGTVCFGILGCCLGMAIDGPGRTHPNDGGGLITLAGLAGGILVGLILGVIGGWGWHLFAKCKHRNESDPPTGRG